MPVAVHVPEINRVVCAGRNGGVAGRTDALGVCHRPHYPAQSVVGGNSRAGTADAISIHAPFVGDVSGAVRGNANVAVQAAAGPWSGGEIDAIHVRERVDRNPGAESQAPVITARAERSDDVLRTVVDSMRIRMRGDPRGGVRTASDGLVIDTCGLTGALCGEPIIAVIVGEGKFACDAIQLRRKGPVCAAKVTVVSEENWIEAQASEGRALVFPEGGGRFEGIIEGDAESVIASLDESFASRPVDANGRLAGAVGTRGCGVGGRCDAAWRPLCAGAVIRSGIIHEGRRARSRGWRRWSGGAHRDGHRNNDVSGGREGD